jgi:glycosyltransferase involved in cell wall biosynthesis
MQHVIITGIFSFPSGEAASNRIRNFSLAFKNINYQPYIFSTSGDKSGAQLTSSGQSFFKTDDDILFLPLLALDKNEFKLSARLRTTLFYPVLIIWLGLKTALFAKRIDSRIIFVYGRSYLLALFLYFFKRFFYKDVKIITDVTEPPYDYQRQKLINIFRWQSILMRCIRLKLLDSLLFFRNLQLFDLVIFISYGLEKTYANSVKRKMVIPGIIYSSNRIEIESIPGPLILQPKLLYLGTFFDKDDPENMFKLLSSLKNKFDEYEIWLAGKFKNRESKYWIAKYLDLFGERLRVFYAPDDEQLKEIISQSHFIICLRKEDELQNFTFPTRIVECLQNRKLIISSAFGDVSLYFKNGENSILVNSELSINKSIFSDSLVKYLEIKTYVSLVESSQKLLYTSFSAQFHVKKIIEILK